MSAHPVTSLRSRGYTIGAQGAWVLAASRRRHRGMTPPQGFTSSRLLPIGHQTQAVAARSTPFLGQRRGPGTESDDTISGDRATPSLSRDQVAGSLWNGCCDLCRSQAVELTGPLGSEAVPDGICLGLQARRRHQIYRLALGQLFDYADRRRPKVGGEETRDP